MGSTTYETARLYINQDDATFSEEFTSKFGTPSLYWVSGVQWLDVDNDGDLDAAFSAGAPTATAQRVFVNSGGLFSESSTGISMVSTGVRVFDSDLDGLQDILYLPGESSDTPHLLHNTSSAGAVQLTDVTAAVGLNTQGRVSGAVVSDFNAGGGPVSTDGDIDIYLGRPSVEEFFFRSSAPNGDDAPIGHYLSLVLAQNGANNASAIGANVTASYPGWQQVQQVDGGSGRGGQDDNVMTFGLGNWTGDVSVQIKWPGGYVQNEIIPGALISPTAPIEIEDKTLPVVQAGSLIANYTVQMNGLLEWTFEWTTDVSSKWERDMVHITGPGSVGNHNASPMYGNADVTVVANAGGGYTHTLRVWDVECQPGMYYFRVKSSTEYYPDGSYQDGSRRVRFCPSS